MAFYVVWAAASPSSAAAPGLDARARCAAVAAATAVFASALAAVLAALAALTVPMLKSSAA
jgi:hypothetical protein